MTPGKREPVLVPEKTKLLVDHEMNMVSNVLIIKLERIEKHRHHA